MRLTRLVRARLSWAGTAFLVAPGEDGHRIAMARTAAHLWVAGAALGVVLLALPGHPERDVAQLALLSAAGLCVAVFHVAAFDQLPLLGFELSAVLGSTLIALGTAASREPAFAFLYLLVIVFSFFFFRLTAALLQAAYAFGAHAVALAAIGVGWQGGAGVLLLTATALVAGIAVALARSRLRILVDRLSGVVQSLDAIVWEAEVESKRNTLVSAGAEKILGYPTSSWLGSADFWARHLHPDDRERVLEESARHAQAGSDYVLDYRMIAADGRVVWFRDVVRVVADESGRPELLRGVMIDITERLALEEQLRQSQKMNAVGRLAGGVAHDLNNVLMAISGSAELLPASGNAGLVERVGHIRAAAGRGAALTQQLLAFSRRQVLQPKRLDVNGVVEELDDMLRRLIAKENRLELRLDPELGYVEADPVQIQQVLLNLVLNARDAVAGRDGLIAIRTSRRSQPQPLVHSDGVVPAGDYVVLEVEDTGCGMDAETRAQIFEPFFTTKPSGEGTGLGLATVYGIVKQSGGHVLVDSGPGRGTSFRIFLPRHDAQPEAHVEADAPRGLAPAGARCSILLVDDDELVRGVVREALRDGGYHVVEADSGERALELCDSARPAIGAVVTDVVMHGMSGRELVSNLESRYPSLKVLYVSGYSDDVLGRSVSLESNLAFLQKPFSLDELRVKLDELLVA